LGKTFWPVALAVPYPHPGHWPIGEVVMATVLVAGLCLVALWYGRRWPFMVTGWYWFLGMLIPVIGLVQVSNQAMADRYAYLPLTGVFIMVVWGVGEAVRRWRLPGLAAGVGAVVMVAACAGRTANQLEYWQNTESLFRHALAVTQGNFVAHNNLGNVLLAEGQVEEAIVQYRKALEMRPGYSDAHSNLGNALLQQGRIEEALARFQRALVLQPRDASVHNNFGNALLSVGRIQEAIVQYEEALDLQPDFAQAHNNLGWSLLQVGRLDEAISHLQRALALRPDYASAHNNLGYALLQKGKVREAIAECAAALKLEPYDTGTLSNLAWVLATWPEAAVRNGAEAMKLARRANQIAEGNDPVVLRALAAAQAESGQFTEAAATARQALQLVGAQSDVALADALKSQVTLYQSGMPFRDTGLTNGPPDRGQP
jgi:Tfp pilus assembly protein PilF